MVVVRWIMVRDRHAVEIVGIGNKVCRVIGLKNARDLLIGRRFDLI